MNTTIRNNKLFCLNCGQSYKLQYPILVDEMTKKINGFNMLHENCPQTWKEPDCPQHMPVERQAQWWWNNGERGSSSEALWNFFMGNPGRKDHPWDPDDFKRCYKLLNAVPEWKSVLFKAKSLSPEWSNLIDNWDKLTEMYEENIRTNWKNYKKIGMYELMEKCINRKTK